LSVEYISNKKVQLSQRGRALLRVVKNFVKSLNVQDHFDYTDEASVRSSY